MLFDLTIKFSHRKINVKILICYAKLYLVEFKKFCAVTSKLSKIFRPFFDHPFLFGSAKVRAFIITTKFIFKNLKIYFLNFKILSFFLAVFVKNYALFFQADCKDRVR